MAFTLAFVNSENSETPSVPVLSWPEAVFVEGCPQDKYNGEYIPVDDAWLESWEDYTPEHHIYMNKNNNDIILYPYPYSENYEGDYKINLSDGVYTSVNPGSFYSAMHGSNKNLVSDNWQDFNKEEPATGMKSYV